MPAATPTGAFRAAAWLNCQRIAGWSIMLFLTELAIIVFLALWQHGVFVPVPVPPASDFVSFYAAGKLALAGTPALAYDQAAHWLAERHATLAGADYRYFFYPPVFLLVCAPLALLPYYVAYGLFQLVILVPFLVVMRAVLRARGWAWVAPVAAFPAVFWTIGVGQNAFLTAALFGGFTLLLDSRPATAGALLGMLCYKPHFGLLAPVALLAGRRWSAILGAAASVATLVAVSIALFGWESWAAYLHAFSGSGQVYQSGAVDFAGIDTPFGAARLLGLPPSLAYMLQAGCAVAMMAVIAWLWHRRDTSAALRHAALPAATLLAVPLALLYDKLLLLLAIGWLVRQARDTGFLSWERLTMALIWPASLLSWPLATAWHLPLGPVTSAAIVLLCARRVWGAATRPQPGPAVAPAQAIGATP